MAKTTFETFEGEFINAGNEYSPCDHASLLYRDGKWVLKRGDDKKEGRYSYLTGEQFEVVWAREDVALYQFDTRLTCNGKKVNFWTVARVEVGEAIKPGLLLVYKDVKGYHVLRKLTPAGVTCSPTSLTSVLSICPQAAEKEVRI